MMTVFIHRGQGVGDEVRSPQPHNLRAYINEHDQNDDFAYEGGLRQLKSVLADIADVSVTGAVR